MQLKPRWSVALPRHFEVRKYHFSPSALQHAWRGGQAPDLKNSPTPRTATSSARRPVRWCLAAWQNWQRWSDAGSHTVVFQKVFYAVEIQLSQNNHGSKRDWLKGEECETALGSRCLASPTRRHLGSPGWMVQLHDTQGWLRVWKPESLKAYFSYKIWHQKHSKTLHCQAITCFSSDHVVSEWHPSFNGSPVYANAHALFNACGAGLRGSSVPRFGCFEPFALQSSWDIFALQALQATFCRLMIHPPSDSWSRKWEPKLDCQR